jgi:hypothetical protein
MGLRPPDPPSNSHQRPGTGPRCPPQGLGRAPGRDARRPAHGALATLVGHAGGADRGGGGWVCRYPVVARRGRPRRGDGGRRLCRTHCRCRLPRVAWVLRIAPVPSLRDAVGGSWRWAALLGDAWGAPSTRRDASSHPSLGAGRAGAGLRARSAPRPAQSERLNDWSGPRVPVVAAGRRSWRQFQRLHFTTTSATDEPCIHSRSWSRRRDRRYTNR